MLTFARQTAVAATIGIFWLPFPASTVASAAGVTVDVALASLDALEVTYRVPSDCRQLRLQVPFDEKLVSRFRATWESIGSCGALVGAVVTAPEGCREILFRVPASTDTHDRVYPPAYPIDGLGIYVHTGAFAPDESCGAVSWRFHSKNGEVVFHGERRGEAYTVQATEQKQAAFTSVYLSAKALPGTGPITVFSPTVPAWAIATLQEASTAVDKRYRDLAGDAGFAVPATVVSNLEDGGRPATKADVSNQRMLRIGLKNYANVADTEASRHFLRGLIAHEFAHVPQGGMLGAPDTAWLAEGGAEFLRWMTLYRLGWRDASQSAADLHEDLTQCLETTGDRAWAAVPERNGGRIPYTCGLVIHVLALAGRQDHSRPVEQALSGFYEALRKDAQASPALWMECAGASVCAPRTIPRLTTSEEPFASAVVAEFARLGIATPNTDPAGPSLRVRYRGQIFAALMAKDCAGSYSFNNTPEAITIVPVDRCKALGQALKVTGFAGVPFADTRQDANTAAREACGSAQTLTLDVAGGEPIPVPCPDAFPPAAPRLRIDAAGLFALMN